MEAYAVFDPAKQLTPVATCGQPGPAGRTIAAVRRKGRDHPISDRERSDPGADRDHPTDEFVAEHGAHVEAGFAPEVGVEIGATQTRGRDLDERVALVDQSRRLPVDDLDLLDTRENDCFHHAHRRSLKEVIRR
jgi:hypothetical protein